MTNENTHDPAPGTAKLGEPLMSLNGTHLASHDETRPHILVINDTQEILDLFRDILVDEEGYRVTLSSFTFQDVRDVEQLAPDLIVLDFLIGGDALGWQMLQKLRMYRPTAGIPIVVCTAALQLVREIEGHLRAKDIFVVLKPFDIDDLVEVVHLALAKVPAPEFSILPN
ncbi:MAG: response regulator [Thermomicrobiales bacterium]